MVETQNSSLLLQLVASCIAPSPTQSVTSTSISCPIPVTTVATVTSPSYSLVTHIGVYHSTLL